mgnify:CR=1 FL=1
MGLQCLKEVTVCEGFVHPVNTIHKSVLATRVWLTAHKKLTICKGFSTEQKLCIVGASPPKKAWLSGRTGLSMNSSAQGGESVQQGLAHLCLID